MSDWRKPGTKVPTHVQVDLDDAARAWRMNIAHLKAAGRDMTAFDQAAARWLILTVEPNRDAAVVDSLKAYNIEFWQPMRYDWVRTANRRCRRRRDYSQVPALPGYVFVRIFPSPQAWYGLTSIEHVTGTVSTIVGDDAKPVMFTDRWIGRFKEIMTFQRDEPHEAAALRAGDIVRIVTGWLEGRIATVTKDVPAGDAAKQIVPLLVDGMGGQVPAKISLADVRKDD
ncbi:MAG: transcription termination/antitermination NusG family protein [Pseudomonadota bacterium]